MYLTKPKENKINYSEIGKNKHCIFSRYFTALSNGEPLPVKERLDMSASNRKTDTALTPELLRTLHKQVFSLWYQRSKS